ncbi:MAG: mannosyltransferase family protein [Candidatus Levybacteria bacterium]|nr:mannosyltransferase family protein [Candidatus Levybacteria bacterium]
MTSVKDLLLKQIGWTLIIIIVSYLGLSFFPINADSMKLNYLQRWSDWDGFAYLGIAENGYGHSGGGYAFFPVYPITIKIVSYFLLGNYLLSALIISWFSLFFASLYLHKLVRLDFNKDISDKTLKYILVFPFSFFFLAAYTESIYLLLTVSAFYYFRKSLYLKSSFLGMLATAARVVGIAIFPALIFEVLQNKNIKKGRKIYSLALIPVGLLGYMFYLFLTRGNAFYFIEAVSTYFGRDQITYPFKALFSYVKNYILPFGNVFASRDSALVTMEFAFSVLFLILIIFVWFKVRKSYAIYAFVAWSMPLMTGRTGSMLRYVLILFPCFIALGILGSKYESFNKFYLFLSSMLLAIFLISFINGYWVA